jgi:N,N'-diacetyllegionaminate synthase
MWSSLKKEGCLVIAEVAQAHDGSLGCAHAYIDAVAKCGADAIKFQTHIAAAESTPSEPWRVKFSFQDDTRYEYWKRMEFTEKQWAGLKEHADAKGLIFLSSPFSIEAAELLKRIGVAAWKIASGEVSNSRLLDFMLDTKLPILLSTGMSDMEEIDKAVERIKQSGCDFAVMQCTSAYPCLAEKVGLNLLAELRERYQCRVGLSDHSGTIFPSLAAATLRADVVEMHVTFSREMFGPDVASSVTTTELTELVRGVRFIEKIVSSPVNKDQSSVELAPMKRLFAKSIVAKRALSAGATLSEADLDLRKPGTGLSAEYLPRVVGKTLNRNLNPGEFLAERDLVAQSVGAN